MVAFGSRTRFGMESMSGAEHLIPVPVQVPINRVSVCSTNSSPECEATALQLEPPGAQVLVPDQEKVTEKPNGTSTTVCGTIEDC